MALTYAKALVSFVRQHGLIGSLKEARREGYLWALLDGNLFHTKMRAMLGTLVGTDSNGNKYYENNSVQFGRHRWVEYKEIRWYDASTVPPEWHGWLHFISDFTPDKLEALKPKYLQPHKPNYSGGGNQYYAKGNSLNPNQRDWNRVQPWTPS